MNKQQIIQTALSYTHRPELFSEAETEMFPLAEQRIGRTLKSQENQSTQILQPTANRFDVPSDYGAIRALEFLSATRRTLLSRDLHTINRFYEGGGTPHSYVISGRKIDVRPFSAGDYELHYWSRPELVALDSTNAVSEAWSTVYIRALQIEVGIWSQNLETIEVAVEAYNADVEQINREAAHAGGDKPAMRRV